MWATRSSLSSAAEPHPKLTGITTLAHSTRFLTGSFSDCLAVIDHLSFADIGDLGNEDIGNSLGCSREIGAQSCPLC